MYVESFLATAEKCGKCPYSTKKMRTGRIRSTTEMTLSAMEAATIRGETEPGQAILTSEDLKAANPHQ